jgi:hypothetical protein
MKNHPFPPDDAERLVPWDCRGYRDQPHSRSQMISDMEAQGFLFDEHTREFIKATRH